LSERVRFLVNGKVVVRSLGDALSEYSPLRPQFVRVVRALAFHPMTVYQLSDSLGFSIPTVRIYLKECISRGYVIRLGRASRCILYAATDKALEVLSDEGG